MVTFFNGSLNQSGRRKLSYSSFVLDDPPPTPQKKRKKEKGNCIIGRTKKKVKLYENFTPSVLL